MSEPLVSAGDSSSLDRSPVERTSWGARLGTAFIALVLGAVYAAAGTVAHQSTVAVAGLSVPWGLILAIAGVICLLVGLRLALQDRLVVGACAIGIVGVNALLSLRSVGGSVLIPQGTPGLVWLFTPAIVAALVLAWPKLPSATRA
ncbi:hypothetical protein WDJ51_08180 [Rathayibacter sp. YIM 133350]|uniref:hypothetical protein n=1 Tax=Rathayibacter sp. YIM 133350 TaxID=3131992 RepID=UPI00307F80C1